MGSRDLRDTRGVRGNDVVLAGCCHACGEAWTGGRKGARLVPIDEGETRYHYATHQGYPCGTLEGVTAVQDHHRQWLNSRMMKKHSRADCEVCRRMARMKQEAEVA